MALRTLVRPRPAPPEADSPADDAALLSRFARTGDQEAFAALVRRHGPAVLGVCRRVLRDGHAAEDTFQAVFMVLAARAGEITRPEALAGWLHGVAVRVSLKARPRRDRRAGGEPVAAVVTPDPAAGLAAVELRAVLDEELARLPNPDRDLLVLIYLDGKTHDEAARAVGCPVGSVAWRLDRARGRLRKRLTRRGVVLSIGLLLLLASVGRAEPVGEPLVRRAATAVTPPRPAAPPAALAARTARGRRLAVLLVLLFAIPALGAWAVFSFPTPAKPGPAAPRGTPARNAQPG